MGGMGTRMITAARAGFFKTQGARARSILTEDDEVDQLKRKVFIELLEAMSARPETISRGLELILVSRNLERVADLATNVAEEVVFIAEARVVKHHMEERHAT
jgi:phosphate transport system protein